MRKAATVSILAVLLFDVVPAQFNLEMLGDWLRGLTSQVLKGLRLPISGDWPAVTVMALAE